MDQDQEHHTDNESQATRYPQEELDLYSEELWDLMVWMQEGLGLYGTSLDGMYWDDLLNDLDINIWIDELLTLRDQAPSLPAKPDIVFYNWYEVELWLDGWMSAHGYHQWSDAVIDAALDFSYDLNWDLFGMDTYYGMHEDFAVGFHDGFVQEIYLDDLISLIF